MLNFIINERETYVDKKCYAHTLTNQFAAAAVVVVVFLFSAVCRGVAMVFAGIGYEMRGKYQRHNAKKV